MLKITKYAIVFFLSFTSATHAYITFDAEDMEIFQEELTTAKKSDSEAIKKLQADIKATRDANFIPVEKRDITTGLFGYRFGEKVTDVLGTFMNKADVPARVDIPMIQTYQVLRDADNKVYRISAFTEHEKGSSCSQSLVKMKKILQMQMPQRQQIADSEWQSLWFTRNAMVDLKCYLDKNRLSISAVDLSHESTIKGLEAAFTEGLIHDVANQLLGKPTQFVHYAMPVGNEYFFREYQRIKHEKDAGWKVRKWASTVIANHDNTILLLDHSQVEESQANTILFEVWRVAAKPNNTQFDEKVATITLGDLFDTASLKALKRYPSGYVIWGSRESFPVYFIKGKVIKADPRTIGKPYPEKIIINTVDKRKFELYLSTGELKAL